MFSNDNPLSNACLKIMIFLSAVECANSCSAKSDWLCVLVLCWLIFWIFSLINLHFFIAIMLVVSDSDLQYYMRTGMCKFGASCKYHHPRQGGVSPAPVTVNVYGYPLRPVCLLFVFNQSFIWLFCFVPFRVFSFLSFGLTHWKSFSMIVSFWVGS